MNCRQYEPIFGSWYVKEELGSGAEGSLYRICRTDALGHEYFSALKAVSVPSSESETDSLMAGGMSLEEVAEYYESVLENTANEFELLAKLKGNSNIVSYEDHEIFRHEEGIGWDILIRLEELTPLVRYSIDNPLSADEVARMARDICRGLSLCRKFGVVHRDIKPDNIFISPSGSYKLGDFGIARIIAQTTFGLSRKGTYEYMAPEVYWGRDYGASVDLYSLGLVIYRYLNDGRMPFMPSSPAALHADDRKEAFLKRINGHEIPPPRCGSDELKRIVLKACAFDRASRYRDADEMLKDLEALVKTDPTGEPVSAVTSETVMTETGGTSKKGLKAAGAVIACLLIACAVWFAIPKEVTDIEISNAESGSQIEGFAETYIGDDIDLSYTIKPDRFRNEQITFASGDESIFTVDEQGVVHTHKTGEASLKMTARDYSEELSVIVVPKVTSIKGIDKRISLTTGDKMELKPELLPDRFAGEPVSFKTKNKKVAKVSKEGKLTAVSAGDTTLTVSSGGCTFKAAVNVADPVIQETYESYESYESYDTYASSPAPSYSRPSYSSSSNKSSSGSSKKKSSSSSANKGYFDSSDDEHF